jgi:hypothetical protein
MATGSKQHNLTLKTTHLPHLISHFPNHRIITGDSPLLPPGRGKPHPDIFEIAAKTLDLDIDGPNGEEIRKGSLSSSFVVVIVGFMLTRAGFIHRLSGIRGRRSWSERFQSSRNARYDIASACPPYAEI